MEKEVGRAAPAEVSRAAFMNFLRENGEGE
jgi:hypothetical protein